MEVLYHAPMPFEKRLLKWRALFANEKRKKSGALDKKLFFLYTD